MIAPVSATGIAPATPVDPKLASAAKQFEAIFVRQMLAEARKTNFDGQLFTSSATDNFREMQDARFADVAAEKGTFGLGKMIEHALAARAQTSAKP